MNVKDIQSKTILSKSQIYDYVINPYVGCQHACMNYHNADWAYKKYGLEDKLSGEWFDAASWLIAAGSKALGIDCQIVF